MDLSIQVQDTIVYIRVAGIIKTPRGFLFEKSKDRYLRTLGGKIKLGESSKEALAREIMEEIETKIKNPTLYAVIENFYTKNNETVQEICFVYKMDEIFNGIVSPLFIEVPMEDLGKHDIRPKQIVDILKSEDNSFKHIIIKE